MIECPNTRQINGLPYPEKAKIGLVTRGQGVLTYHTFRRDSYWNFAGLGIVAVGGVLMNILVARHYGSQGLGVFNQVLALFQIVSQVAVFGVHLSTLHKLSLATAIPDLSERRTTCRSLLSSSIIATALVAIPTALVGFAVAPLIGMLFGSADVQSGWLMVLPGLVFFAFNKVLLNTVNALHHMRAYAIFSSVRYVFITLFILLFVIFGSSVKYVAASLSLAEGALFLVTGAYIFWYLPPMWERRSPSSVREHLRFGSLALMGHAVAGLNSKIDILVLAIFVNDATVGIYSLVSLMFEGLALVPQIARNISNPVIARAILEEREAQLGKLFRQARIWAFQLTALGAIGAMLLFFLLALFAFDDRSFLAAYPALFILLGSLVVTAPWAPFDMLFSQAGRPAMQSLFKVGVFAMNLALNLVLIPYCGMIGAAIATACAQIGSVLLLKAIARRALTLSV